jgi:hypothetical protein
MKSKCHTPEHNLSAEPDSLPVYKAALAALYIRAHHGPGRIHGHHHRPVLLHPGQLGLGLADGRVVGEGFTSSEHRLQQRPHRRPVGRLKRPDLQGGWGGSQSSARVAW